MIHVDVMDAHEVLTEEQVKMLEELMQFGGKYLDYKEEGECSIVILNNDEIQSYNLKYRDKNVPTDVLSFALLDEIDDELEYELHEDNISLGDILISYEKTKEQAEEYGHTFERELGFLAIHGLLHLMGHDHIDEKQEQEMIQLQKGILQEFGLYR